MNAIRPQQHGLRGTRPRPAHVEAFILSNLSAARKVKADWHKNFEEAADDYGSFLNSNRQFASCFTVKNDPLAFADKLQQAGYATAPDYAKQLESIIVSNDLLQYDK